jgi:photosystem II stability/assembly factor-like uncharacterized protein
LWHTENGGRTWESVRGAAKTGFGGLGFFFLDDHHGWAVSGETEGNIEGGQETGHVFETIDGGRTFKEIARLTGQTLWSVFFLNEQQGWAGGLGSLLKTEDGGHTWSEVLLSNTFTDQNAD